MKGIIRVIGCPEGVDVCWVADDHWDHEQHRRTELGDLVYRGKYQGDRATDRGVAEVLRDLTRNPRVNLPAGPVMVAVPGYPPSDEAYTQRIATALSRLTPLRPVVHSLRRTRGGVKTKRLAPAQRRSNLLGAFEASGDLPPHVVILDDLYQTGATVEAVAIAARRGGAEQITAIAAVRVRRGMWP